LTFFAPEFRKDYKMIGMSIDWSREFHTTALNPYYDKFIRWQFQKLKEKNFVIQGRFPVVWCTKCNEAIGDHSRSEGEGETTQEFTLLKFKFGDEFIIAATLRPETVFGQTNLWCGADIEYVRANVNGQVWILSRPAALKLAGQDKDVKIIGTINGKDLIGKFVKAPFVNHEVPILPSFFCNPEKGSGIVTSVPSDAPDDWMGLSDLQNDESLCKKYGLDRDMVRNIKPIPIINSKDLGNMPAIKVCKDMGIKSQHDRDKLDEAKKLVYKKGFYEGVMAENCGKFSGMPVEKAKDLVKHELLDFKQADKIYELTGRIVCRCLSPAVVKIVSDQWFLNYADPKWKELAHECLNNIKLYPEKSRQQFDYVIDWLHEWACTREEGLGTKLPWDEKWLIESLSDSTIYMAYYTINKHLVKLPLEQVNDQLFDCIFLNAPDPSGVDSHLISVMKSEFNYWYPVDFRNSGKDLVQNHLTFFIFNHVAIFPKDKWPKGIGVNGWVTVDGQKMSKSLGNMIPIRDVASKFSVDSARFTILTGGEGLDDPNWETDLAESMKQKLPALLDLIPKLDSARSTMTSIDHWAESELNRIIKKAEDLMEQTLFRSAIQVIYFELQQMMKWYLRRCSDPPNKLVLQKCLEAQFIMLSPFAPHICEEAWEKMGKNNFISLSSWPKYDSSKIQSSDSESVIRNLIDDIRSVLKLAKVDSPNKISLFVSLEWKYELFRMIKSSESKNPKDVLAKVMSSPLKVHGQEIMKIVPKLLSSDIPDLNVNLEYSILADAQDFFAKEFNCEVVISKADDVDIPKAKQASPGKPAILVE
jgi:leucyl-tRNA synthetase